MLKIIVVLFFVNVATGQQNYSAPTVKYGPNCGVGLSLCPTGMVCDTNICICPSPFQTYVNGECRVIPGGKCDTRHPCIHDAICNRESSKCVCKIGKAEDGSERCGNIPGQPCTLDEHCTQNPPTFCNKQTGMCTCHPSAYGIPGQCFIGYGHSCKNDAQCHGPWWMGLSCVGGTCGCAYGQEFIEDHYFSYGYTNGRCEIPLGFRCMVNGMTFGSCGDKAICSSTTGLCACGPYSFQVRNGICSCDHGAYVDDVERTTRSGVIPPPRICKCFENSLVEPGQTDWCKCPMHMYANRHRRQCKFCPSDAFLESNTCTCPSPRHFNEKANACL